MHVTHQHVQTVLNLYNCDKHTFMYSVAFKSLQARRHNFALIHNRTVYGFLPTKDKNYRKKPRSINHFLPARKKHQEVIRFDKKFRLYDLKQSDDVFREMLQHLPAESAE